MKKNIEELLEKAKAARKKAKEKNKAPAKNNEKPLNTNNKKDKAIEKLSNMVQDTEDHCLDRVEELNHRRTAFIGQSKVDSDKNKSWNVDDMQVVIEMLLNSAKPTSISPNIISFKNMHQEDLGMKIGELSAVDFIRKLRGNIRIIGEYLASHAIAKSDRW